jgi:hypothetical protein
MSDDLRKPFIKFETVCVEDRQASAQSGLYMVKEQDMIVIIPYGSEGKTELREEYTFWLDKMKKQIGPIRAPGGDSGTPMIMESRFPREWLEAIEKGYAAWKRGEELPVDGTPLKQWAVLPPSIVSNFIANNILTIEQLAVASDEAINPVGMGARIYRNQAQDWIKLNKESERNKMVTQITQMAADNARLTMQVAAMLDQIKDLAARVPNTDTTAIMQNHAAKKAA